MVTAVQLIKLCLVIPKAIGFFLTFCLFNLGRIVAPDMLVKRTREKLKKKGGNLTQNMEIKTVDDMAFLFSWDMVRMQIRKAVKEIFNEVALGQAAPNPELVSLASGKSTLLLEYAKQGRPLVLNFGSCT